MPSIKISALTEKTTMVGTEEVLINDSGTSKKFSTQRFLDVKTAAETAQTAAELAETNAAADLVLTNADVVLAEAAKVQTGLDRVATAADVVLAEADKVQTGLDRAAVAADLILTAADTVATAADLVATNADVVLTGLDVDATNADVVLTNADVVTSTAQAGIATTQAGTATTQAGNASTSATAAGTSETNAGTSETNASNSASSATTAQAAAEAARDSALAAFDSFDDRYLGQKATAPTLDNDGDALVAGTLYFNTSTNEMKVYDGSSWLNAYASLSGALLATSNLSDLNNAGTARTNLGVDAAGTVNYTHPANHAISVTTGLQAALDGKVDDAQVLTNVPSGAVFTDTNTTYSVGDGGLSEINFTSADHTKLNAIEASADVTDATNVTAAGALMDSEVTNLADVKAFDTTDYATAAQGATANAALPKAGGAMTGAITTNSTFDGRDVATDGSKLDGIEAGATADQTGAEILALFSNSITAGHIAAGAIGASEIGNDVVNSQHYAAGSIDNEHIADNAINSEHYADGSIDRAHLAADIIDGTKIANDVINSEHYAAGSIDNEHIADNAINSEHYADNSIDALHLNVSGNGTTSQYLRSDGDGTMSWVTPPNTNTTYSADGNYGMTLSGTAFRLENDRRRNATGEDVWSGNTHDYTWYDASQGIRWYTAGSEEMRLENDGDLHVDGDVVAYSATVSDSRLKEDIKPIVDALDKVKQLNGCTFTYINDGKESAGLIAQDVEKVLPSAVSEKELPLKKDDGKAYKTVQYDQTIGLLVEAIKELSVKVEALENNGN